MQYEYDANVVLLIPVHLSCSLKQEKSALSLQCGAIYMYGRSVVHLGLRDILWPLLEVAGYNMSRVPCLAALN
jgi:hypothetical protein